MKKDKQIRTQAKALLKMSMEGDSVSEERVNAVLQGLEKHPPRHPLAVLKDYLKLVRKEISQSQAVVAHAGEISPSMVDVIGNQLSQRYGRSISVVTREDPSLIAGLRVGIGCDIYDSSIAGNLNELESSLA